MPATNEYETAWDFAPVLELLSYFRQQRSEPSLIDFQAPSAAESTPSGDQHKASLGNDRGVSLGDFKELWDYLGIKQDAPPPSVPPFEATSTKAVREIRTYESDGALYYPPSSKAHSTKDNHEDTTGAVTEGPSGAGLTKNQRKKRNKKARKDAEYAELVTNLKEQKKVIRQAFSDNETRAAHPATEEDASSRQILPTELPAADEVPSPNHDARRASQSDIQDTDFSSSAADNAGKKSTYKYEIRRLPDTLLPAQVAPKSTQKRAHKQSLPTNTLSNVGHLPEVQTSPAETTSSNNSAKHTPKVWPEARPFEELAKSLEGNSSPATPLKKQLALQTPATVPSKSQTGSKEVFCSPQKKTPSQPPVQAVQQSTGTRRQILPFANQSIDDRHWSLLLKLIHNFPADRSSLLSPLQLSINRPQPQGIHVFVDASNILIGFQEHLKRARGIPFRARVPRVYPSFHALALLLERRRPVAKRVLVGSTPEVPAYEEARQVGYETAVLDKVFKVREPTSRQRYLAAQKQEMRKVYRSTDSEDENTMEAAASSAKAPKWVEQGVDEILHLKMLESLVDGPTQPPTSSISGTGSSPAASQSPPTMILATGDAAVAEYSSGFLKMVERALSKGWCVEVAAWGESISSEYHNLGRKTKYEGKFRVIELDDYAEELFPAES